jgi:hypothetical protein
VVGDVSRRIQTFIVKESYRARDFKQVLGIIDQGRSSSSVASRNQFENGIAPVDVEVTGISQRKTFETMEYLAELVTRTIGLICPCAFRKSKFRSDRTNPFVIQLDFEF